MTAESASPNQHQHLTSRAVEFIRARGGCVAEDDLVGFVFGSSGSPQLWAPLLRQILAGSQGIHRQADGVWSLAGALAAQKSNLLDEFISLDVETTGLRPLSQRVIEIAMIHYRDGREIRRLETLINPGRAIPKYIVELTRIDNEMVEHSPAFADLASDVHEFIQGALIVGHNVGFDIGFLNAEFSRVGMAQLINDRLDTMSLANRIIPSLRRPSLDRIAKELGLLPRKIHRAGVDAEITAEVAARLASKAQTMGVDSVERLRLAGKGGVSRPKDDVGRGRALLDRSIIANVPKVPGVYLMRDVNGRIIYAGKAKNLKDRLNSYFSQPLGYTRKMDGLLESIASIETIKTGSELSALLLEAQLIVRHQPRYNTVMRTAERYPLIKIDLAGKWPRVTLSKSRKDDGARYFGPFKNPRGAKNAVDLINRFFPLRTCARSFKTAASYGSPCLRLGMKQCLGPCTGQANRDDYLGHVHRAIAFLDGDDTVMFDAIWNELDSAATKLDYEKARRLRNDLQTLRTIVDANQLLRRAEERGALLLVQPGPERGEREVMLIVRGRRWASFIAGARDTAFTLAARLEASWSRFLEFGLAPVTQLSLDEANILGRWLARHDGHPAIRALEDDDPQNWAQAAAWALALDDDDLSWTPSTGEDIVIDGYPEPFAVDAAGEFPDPAAAPVADLILTEQS